MFQDFQYLINAVHGFGGSLNEYNYMFYESIEVNEVLSTIYIYIFIRNLNIPVH